MPEPKAVTPCGQLWRRWTTLGLPGGGTCELLSPPDLVLAKKTLRDTDGPMIRRLGILFSP